MQKQTNFEIPAKLKERFCRDYSLPIKIFEEPYFTERLELMDKIFPSTLENYDKFIEKLKTYDNPQDYLEEYNKIKDEAIDFIKNTEAFQDFNNINMNIFAKEIRQQLPSHDIFKPSNIGRYFISIDMKKANFNALRNYNPEIFGNAATWEEFISKFTDNKYIIKSKYIRQVILGNCNPKRHVTYEKYLMNKFLTVIEDNFHKKFFEKIAFFSNDEIIFDITDLDMDEETNHNVFQRIQSLADKFEVPLKVEQFQLGKVTNTDGYIKNGSETEFKCLDSTMYPIVLRKFFNERIQENDKVFIFNGMKARLIDLPEIELIFKQN